MTAHVLVVEDNLADVELIREVLLDLEETYELHAVEDGVQALAFLRREGPFAAAPPAHLVLLDLNTPRLGGLELLSEVREEGRWEDVRRVVFSSCLRPEDERRALDLGADACVVKPAGWEAFSETIREILTRWAVPPAAARG